MLAGRRSIIKHRIAEQWHGDLKKLLPEGTFSTLLKDEYTVILQIVVRGEVLRFEELVDVFPSDTLKAQLMLVAK